MQARDDHASEPPIPRAWHPSRFTAATPLVIRTGTQRDPVAIKPGVRSRRRGAGLMIASAILASGAGIIALLPGSGPLPVNFAYTGNLREIQLDTALLVLS